MYMAEALGANSLQFGFFRFTISPCQSLIVPGLNKGNMLRGGFGHAFRRLCCVPQCRDAKQCFLATSCPYKAVFEPSPPVGADRLSKNQDIPRPFVFRAPQTNQTRYEVGDRFEFGLVLIGRALDYLPYFVLSFRQLALEGLGLNRAKCILERVEQLDVSKITSRRADPNGGQIPEQGLYAGKDASTKGTRISVPNAQASIEPGVASGQSSFPLPPAFERLAEDYSWIPIYTADDQIFRSPLPTCLDDYLHIRLRELESEARHAFSSAKSPSVCPFSQVTVRFLTPTYLRAGGETISQPEFHHILKRLRDRVNTLSIFFGEGPLEIDFRGLGERSEQVRTVCSQVQWVERFRTSSKTRQRHELSGFVGEVTYEGALHEFLPWLIWGEVVHIGKHAAWGNGWYQTLAG
jgi:CRISPR/Cas system endoribonuclease Cas6 (RAMP superfamily)